MRPELGDFAGAWRLTRRIEDRLSGTEGQFAGLAQFAPAPLGLAYHETGLLRLGRAAPVRAERQYLWREEAGRILVNHADGRPFHDFDPADPAARHWCAPDDYRVAYDFSRWPEWRADWEVRGPRKDYSLHALYCRA